MNSKLILLLLGVCSAVQLSLGCEDGCQDYHRHCDNLNDGSDIDEEGLPLFNGVDLTCDTDYVKSRCPRTCNVCEACDYASADSVADLSDQQSQIDDLQSQLDQVSSSSNNGLPSDNSSPLDQGEVPQDSDGYRLFFRSSSSEVTFDEINPFFTTGRPIGGLFRNRADSSQFRDNNFFWYHADNNQMRYSIYAANGDLFATVDFDFGNDRPIILKALDDAYVVGSSYWDDLVVNSGQEPWRTMDVDAGRFFSMIKNYGGCEHDKVWFLGSNKDATACTWDYRWTRDFRSTSLDKVVYLYNPLNDAGYSIGRMDYASHFEISYRGADFSKLNNGFDRVFRYGALSGINILSFYDDGTTDSSADRSTTLTGKVFTDDLYRSSNMQSQIEGASKVLLVVYGRDGNVAEALTFNANSDFKTWMSKDNLVANLLWEFDEIQFFAVNGDQDWGRWFFINRNYGGCTVDAGWLAIPCLRDDAYVPCNEWDGQYTGGNVEGQAQMCPILYSVQSAATPWYNEDTTRYGSAIEIFVK